MKKGEDKREWKSVALWIGIIALILSGYNTYFTHYYKALDIVAGREIRLYVAILNDTPYPCILMSLSFINDGGATVVTSDVELDVKWLIKGNVLFSRDFKLLREVPNFIYAEGNVEQSPITPVVVLGKSVVNRQYAFIPYIPIPQDSIPPSFDLEIKVLMKSGNEWLGKRTYIIKNISGIWQDIYAGPTYKGNFFDISEK